MGEASRVEGETFISSGERSLTKSNGSSDPYICNDLLQIAGGFVQRDWNANKKILVGRAGWLKENPLEKLGNYV